MKDQKNLYRHVVRDAFKLSWKYKYLWPLGLLGLLFSNIGVLKHLLKYSEHIEGSPSVFAWKNFSDYLLSLFHLEYWINLFSQTWIVASVGMILLAIIFGIFLWLSVNAQISILESVKYYLRSTKEKIRINNLFAKSQKKFWPVFSINMIRYALLLVIGGAVGVPFLYYLRSGSFVIYLIGAFVLLFLLSIISFVCFYVYAYIVFYGKSLGQAIKAGENLFSKYWLVSIEMAALLFFIDFLMALFLSGLGLFIILSLLWLIVIQGFLLQLSILLLIIVFSIVSILLVAWLYNFQVTAWGLLFLVLQDGKASSKTGRILKRLKSKK